MKTLTVFTPTYNRAFCLGQLYESLCRQTSSDFLWLIIDDGSTDDTKALVAGWIAQDRIQIQYHYQQNQGMHAGHNAAYARIETELNVCIDSDDFMPDDAVQKILDSWLQFGSDRLAGIIGLDAFKDQNIVGTPIPNQVKQSTLGDIYGKYGVTGDKKLVLRTSVVKEFPAYPTFEGEKLVPLGTLYLMIDQRYQYLCRNEVYCIVEYLEDGSSRNILKQYRKSPFGFAYNRIVKMRYAKSFSEKFKNAVHLVSSALFANDFALLTQSPNKILTFLAFPFGLLLNLYIRYKTKSR